MNYAKTTYGVEKEILKYDHKIAVPVLLDFAAVTTNENGVKVVKAGTPLKSASGGAVVGNTTSDDVIGILWKNCYETDPNGTMIIHGVVDKAKAESASGLTYGAWESMPKMLVLD